MSAAGLRLQISELLPFFLGNGSDCTRRVIARLEDSETVSDEVLQQYTDPESPKRDEMIEKIRKELNFTTLRYNRLDDMLDAVGIPKENLCTYCWNGKE